ncbi:hypothetical protein O0555_18345 [Brevibacillus laterosporus]|uniref:alpha/beta hydrolase n=1 Tax=Brevibacillus laterosporus TaxID=1465 RepID=UPI001F54BF39|nr:hypothetical protein [Brevibacillus laterosporus]MCR8939280.1 hypothetical protein [Brevibacillus laterosporus]MCZ0841920.1 hypothetical protein [Brevibacillus laterosporus]MCZ0846024.1 hypothetical protein [Brevibacillus laterosporus]MED1909720.1 hypothetical protein [Brevibacillus laterosporus]
MTTKKKFYQKKQWMILISIIVIPILLISVTNQFTPALKALVIKQIFEAKPFASPKNIETIKKQVVVKKDIVYDEAGLENSILDIYYPKNSNKNLPVIRFDNPHASTLGKIFFNTMFWSYTGEKDIKSFSKIDEISTVKQITPNYPPVFLTVGDADPLAPHSADLIDVLQINNVEVESVLFEGTKSELGHEYQFDFSSSHAEKTLEKTIEFLNKHRNR